MFMSGGGTAIIHTICVCKLKTAQLSYNIHICIKYVAVVFIYENNKH